MFTERLSITVELTIKSDAFTIAGGAVSRARLALEPHGFTGEVSFWVSTEKAPDKLLPRFISPDYATVRVTVSGGRDKPSDAAPPLSVEGVVVDRTVVETSSPNVKGNPVLVRSYTVTFADRAAALWRQHYPSLLDVETTLGDVIGAQLAGGMKVDSSALDDLGRSRPLVCLNLGGGEASFYDFLLWYLDRQGAGLLFDYAAKQYLLVGEKPAPTGKPALLEAVDIASLALHLPVPPRHRTRVGNSHTDSARTVTVDQDNAVDGLLQDRLLRTPAAAVMDEVAAVEGLRLRSPLPEVAVEYARWPWRDLTPGAGVGLAKEYFSKDLFLIGRKYRVGSFSLDATSVSARPSDTLDGVSREYQTIMTSRWESLDDKVFRHPGFRHPRYPCLAEGKIQCDGGEAGDRTYMVAQDQKTGESFYKVLVPLWNKKVKAPFEPQFTVGNFYAPAFKDSRVLLALHFDRAEILQFLDWGADVQLPNDTQGNQILFGRNKTSQTALTHAYVDSKPQFSLNRSCNGDLQVLTLQDGGLVLETKVDQSQVKASETFDLTPQAAAAKEAADAAAVAAVGDVTAATAKSKAALAAKTDTAKSRTSASLDAMDGELQGQADAAKAAIDSALQDLSGQGAALKSKSTAAVAELKSKLGGL